MTAHPKIALLIADVDGTLVTRDKVLTDRARRAALRLRDAGIRLAVTSGRPPRGMAMLAEPLQLQEAIAGFNGGMYVRPDLSVLEERTLDPDVAWRAIALLRDRGLDAWVYSGADWLVHDPEAPHVAREAWTVKFPPTVVAGFDGRLDSVVKIVGVSDDLALVERVEAEARTALGGSASAARSQPYYLDITHPSANKGAVVEHFARTLDIDPAEIATIGDMPNDVLMFRRSGFSIAMGNASPEVQRQASATTDSSEQEGFAKAVERFLLGEAVPDFTGAAR